MAQHLARRRRFASLTLERGAEGVVGFMAHHPLLFWLLAMWVVLVVYAQIQGWEHEERPEPGSAVILVCQSMPEMCTPPSASF